VFLCKKNRLSLSPLNQHLKLLNSFLLLFRINTKNISFTHHTPKEIQDKFSRTRDPNASHNDAQKKRKRRAKSSLWFENPRALLPFCRYLSKKHLK